MKNLGRFSLRHREFFLAVWPGDSIRGEEGLSNAAKTQSAETRLLEAMYQVAVGRRKSHDRNGKRRVVVTGLCN